MGVEGAVRGGNDACLLFRCLMLLVRVFSYIRERNSRERIPLSVLSQDLAMIQTEN